nr:GntR family transcriptional regulator [Paenibacillus thalictri]
MVYSRMKESILSGKLRPGDRLNIGVLAKEFSISEIPVREAIQVLESEHLIKIIPHTGAIVAPVSTDELHEIYELRMYFEALATFLATPFLTQDDFNELDKNVKKQRFCVEYNELEEFGELNLAFHQLIYNKNPNKRLNSFILNLWENSKRYKTVFTDNLEFTKGSLEEHVQLVQILKEQDAKQAELTMKRHLMRATVEIKRKWKNIDTP